jgi:hypothetical protein
MKRILLAAAVLVLALPATAIKITSLSDLKGNELQVTEIDLSNKGLSEFPEQILACKYVQVINLSNNGILGLPEGIKNLSMLRHLDLSENDGLNPVDFNSVMQGATFQLESLDLSGCNLFFIPESVAGQKKLTAIDLSGNRLSSLPHSMMNMSWLKRIDLSDNFFTELAWMVNYWWGLKSIDVSRNKDLPVSDVLMSLSYFDQLDEVVVSDVNFFPKDFALLNVHRLTIRNSMIETLPRTELSRPVDQLIVDGCHFKNASRVVKDLNDFAGLNYVEFRNVLPLDLIPFLALNVDSVRFQNIIQLDLEPLAKVEQLKWVDVRGVKIDPASLAKFKTLRPDVEVMHREAIPENIGVAPPIERFVAEPILKTIVAGKDQDVDLGRTQVAIPANGIMDANGTVYTGPVTLAYKEYMTPEDVFFSGITMTSNEGDEPLVFTSGGMFELTATDAAGNELFVNPEEPLNVEMYSGSANSDMDLFKFNEQTGTWEYVGKDSITEPFQSDEERMDSIMNSDFLALVKAQVRYVNDRYIPVVKKNRKYRSFQLSFDEYTSATSSRNKILEGENYIQVFNTDYQARFLCSMHFMFEGDSAQHYYNVLKEMNTYCRDSYKRLRLSGHNVLVYETVGPNFISQLELVPDFENDIFRLQFRFKDELFSLPVSFYPTSGLKAGLRETKNFYRRYLRAWKQSQRVKLKNEMKLQVILKRRADLFEAKAIAEEYQRREAYGDNPELLTEAAGQGSIVRAFAMDGFGTWNCDARSRMKSPAVVAPHFVAEMTGAGINEAFERIVVIDHQTNGVIQFLKGEETFFDKASRSTVVVFFTATMVGIYQSWKNTMTHQNTEIKLLDIENMNKETFVSFIRDDA